MTTHDDLLERIRSRAYELWLEDGQPLGRDSEHWARAEAEVLAEMSSAVAADAAPLDATPADASPVDVTPMDATPVEETPAEETPAETPAPKAPRRRTTKEAADADEAKPEGEDAPKPKRTRRATKAKTGAKTEAKTEDGVDADSKPKRATRRKKTDD